MWFTNVIKPTHRCNLSCAYCYNEDARGTIMEISVLRRVIEETFSFVAALPGNPSIDFIWHGGEPLLAGLDFFRAVVKIEKEVSGKIGYANSVQTNGTLLNEEWVGFLKEESFDVSLSIDGPLRVNDATRYYSQSIGAFNDIMKGISLLRKYALPHGVCVVLSRSNIDKVEEIHRFLVAEKLQFNIIPLTRSGKAAVSFEDLGLGPAEYASAWIKLFDLWFDTAPQDYVSCTDFVRKARSIIIGRPTDCIGQEQCGTGHISTDQDGCVYPCATLSGEQEWAYGNIRRHSLAEVMSGSAAREVCRRKADPHCSRCKWQHICHGGCMARSLKFFGTYNRRDYYCPSLYRIYEHIEKRLKSLSEIDLGLLRKHFMRDNAGISSGKEPAFKHR